MNIQKNKDKNFKPNIDKIIHNALYGEDKEFIKRELKLLANGVEFQEDRNEPHYKDMVGQ